MSYSPDEVDVMEGEVDGERVVEGKGSGLALELEIEREKTKQMELRLELAREAKELGLKGDALLKFLGLA